MPVDTTGSFPFGKPVALFKRDSPTSADIGFDYAVTPNGKRFLFLDPAEEAKDAQGRPRTMREIAALAPCAWLHRSLCGHTAGFGAHSRISATASAAARWPAFSKSTGTRRAPCRFGSRPLSYFRFVGRSRTCGRRGAVIIADVAGPLLIKRFLDNHVVPGNWQMNAIATERLLAAKSGMSDSDRPLTEQGLRRMTRLAQELRQALQLNDLNGFGEVLHQGWIEKKKLASGISNPKIDAWYEIARQNGAIGGKLLGAGGGGFLLLYAPPECHTRITNALPELRRVGFNLEPQGSKIIYVE